MQPKTIEIACNYLLEEISVSELSAAFQHHMNKHMLGELPSIYNNWKFDKVQMNPLSANELANDINSNIVEIGFNASIFRIEIVKNKELGMLEILFR